MTALSSRALPLARRASALYCATHGSGTPLLLIHGFGASGQMFQPLLASLSAAHTVLVPDLRGHGKSQRLPLADSVARLAADLDDLLDLLGGRPAFVLGHGGGAAVAQQLAHDFPGRVRGLILVSATARATSPSDGAMRRLRSGLSGLLGERGERAGGCSSYAGNQLLQTFDSRPWLGTLTMPTLVLAGADDAVAPMPYTREIAGRLPRCRLEVIPGAGHSLLETHPGQVLAITLPWLRQQEAAA
jgi:non-heme chloroperoxidase